MSVIAIVMMITYSTFAGVNYLETATWSQKVSFGNIGFPSAYCTKHVIDETSTKAHLFTQCQGNTKIARVISSGLLDPLSEEIVRSCEAHNPSPFFDQTTFN